MAQGRSSPVATCSRVTALDPELDGKFLKCCVCSGHITSINQITLSYYSEESARQLLVCRNLCAQSLTETVRFVQGFMLCRVLCTLLDVGHNRNSKSKTSVKLEDRPPTVCPTRSLNDSSRYEDRYEDDDASGLPISFFPAALDSTDDGSGSVIVHAEDVSQLSKSHKKSKTRENLPRSNMDPYEPPQKKPGSSVAVEENSKVTCPECGKKFRHNKSLDSHRRLKHKKDARPCRVCGKEFYGAAGLSIHMHMVHKEEKAVDCDLCDEKFSSCADRERHMVKDHGKKYGMCHICGKYFRYSWTLRSHLLAHSGVRRFVCEHCGKGFLRSNTLIVHRNLVHNCHGCKKLVSACICPDGPKKKVWSNCPKKSAIDNFTQLRCYMCNKTLENIHAYETHMDAHKSERPYGCDKCDKRFMHKTGLTSHMQQHKEKRFACDICKKTFTYRCNMVIHRETHNEGKPYVCEFCSKTFKTKVTLENHRNRHIEERQFKCHICGKGLAKSHNLKVHLKVMHQYDGPETT